MDRYIIIIFWIFSWSLSIAQVDTSVVLDDILLSVSNIRTEDQLREQVIDKDGITGSVAQSIEQATNTYIKNYGVGSLATLSIRGGSAGQSLLLWNGLPLHSPMLGLLDLSLIPNNVTESTSISKGGNSSLWGSGAVSGVVSMESNKVKNHTVALQSSVGSFGYMSHDASIHLNAKKWHFTSKYAHESADRDFEYSVSSTLPRRRQENARYNRNHFMQDIYYDINSRNQLSAHVWSYRASTEIPPTTVQSKSEAHQDDNAVRSMVNWKYIGDKSLVNTKVGYFMDHNDFYNPQTLTEANNEFYSLFADVNIQHQINKHIISLGSTYNETVASSKGYQGSVSESRVSLFGIHQYDLNKLQFKTSLRKEYIDGINIPLLPNFSVIYTPVKYIGVNTKVSRNFRAPTLNDRFWKPGGDQNLNPESGWSGEFGLSIDGHTERLTWTYSTTAFYRDMKDWILWSPKDNVPFWSAQNINNVVSKGIEQQLSIQYQKEKIEWNLDLKYDYISSTFQTALDLPKVEAGDQLFYTPLHNARVSLRSTYKNWSLDYRHMFTGQAIGVNEVIPQYHVGNTQLSYQSAFNKVNYKMIFSMNNIFNNRYFIVERRPIVGRNYTIGIAIKY